MRILKRITPFLLCAASCLVFAQERVELRFLGRYASGIFDEGAAEISAYDPVSNKLFFVNGDTGSIDILDISNPKKPTLTGQIDVSSIGSNANSVAVNNGIVAAAIEANEGTDNGSVALFDTDGNLLTTVTVGSLPDMLIFTPDGNKILVANEGEPNDDYTVDPEGSISIVDISGGAGNATVMTAGFGAFNDNFNPAIRVFGPGANLAQDLEPEYIAVSSDSKTAWAICQENNAIAVVDIDAAQVVAVAPLGFKDHSLPGNALDVSNRDDAINIANWPVYGMYQPDAITAYNVGGTDYIISANEGDSRDYDGFSEEERVKDLTLDPSAFPNAADLQEDENLGRLKITTTLGDDDGDGDYDRLFAYGARSFSIWDGSGNLIWDSGDQFETILADLIPEDFNSTNDENDSFDNRSDDKGPEPEGVSVAYVNGAWYAFIGLERVGGVMIYNVTDPANPFYVDYVTGRNFKAKDATSAEAGDLAPEGLLFIPALESPTGDDLLVISNEVSGTISIYRIELPRPLSSMVAVTSPVSIVDRVKALVSSYAEGTLPEDSGFPLENTITDTVRTLPGMNHNVVARWLDPLTDSDSPYAPKFGANADFITYFGDGWDANWSGDVVGNSPYITGSSTAGWIWSNHEYISNSRPNVGSAPNGQSLTFAYWLKEKGILDIDVEVDEEWDQAAIDTYINWHKKQLGGSWFRVYQETPSGEWKIDLSADSKRYDSTSDTQVTLTGTRTMRPSFADDGRALDPRVVAGIAGDCSGAQSPWGTVITAEENVQSYYGDVETSWTSRNRFVPGEGFDPGSVISFNVAPGATDGQRFGRHSDPNTRKDRDQYGYLTEIDPGKNSERFYRTVTRGGDGEGHRKIGGMGRARWENAAFATDANFDLIDGQPITIYGGNDRRSGRIYKFVSDSVYREGMTRARVRRLLDSGYLYVAHFAGLDHTTGKTLYDPNNPDGGGIVPTEDAPGYGEWIRMSVFNTAQIAPNAEGLGDPRKTVGSALRDVNWNGIGGFSNNYDVRRALFTAANKLGVAELNRPEDIEYNPRDISGTPRLYVAFTNHTRPAVNNQQGVLDDTTPSRTDTSGSIFAMEEDQSAEPGRSRSFKYWRVWNGFTPDSADEPAPFAAGDPDNLAIGANGEVFFGTDGNPGSTGRTRADAIYYLDLDPAHKDGAPGVVNPTYGKAFRFVASPADSEATGPWFTPDGRTLFFNVQHPGENFVASPSTWPQDR